MLFKAIFVSDDECSGPKGWKKIGADTWFKKFPQSKDIPDFFSAQRVCSEFDAELATVNSPWDRMAILGLSNVHIIFVN
jgi:hypothetical protein